MNTNYYAPENETVRRLLTCDEDDTKERLQPELSALDKLTPKNYDLIAMQGKGRQ